jgi:hypothetical protein
MVIEIKDYMNNAQSQLLSERVKEKFEISNQICGITKLVRHKNSYLTVRVFLFEYLWFNLYYDWYIIWLLV